MAQRRERPSDQSSWTTLPAAGRQGDPPAWPLSRASTTEKRQWEREWKRPQAVAWEAAHQEEEVAVYVRTLIAGDPKSLSVLMRQQEALGLSQPGLARRRWKIEQEPTRQERTQTDDADRAAKKAKLRQIVGGAA